MDSNYICVNKLTAACREPGYEGEHVGRGTGLVGRQSGLASHVGVCRGQSHADTGTGHAAHKGHLDRLIVGGTACLVHHTSSEDIVLIVVIIIVLVRPWKVGQGRYRHQVTQDCLQGGKLSPTDRFFKADSERL